MHRSAPPTPWRSRPRCGSLAGLLIALSAIVAPAAEPLVSFELLLEDPYAQTSARQWHELLDSLPQVNVRIRSGRPGERTGVEERGGDDNKSFRVTGILTARNRLDLPGASFSPADRAKLIEWINRLRDGGADNLGAPRLAFGLTAEQLTATHAQLSHVVTTQTKGLTVAEAARRIAAEAKIQLQSDPEARAGAAEQVDNELRGLSAGTALAAALRPGGLVLTLEPSRRDVLLRIRAAASAKEFWPIGWPLDDAPGNVAPEIFKELAVEINNFALEEALGAVAQRLPIPFLFDHNALVVDGIDPTTVKVSHPAGRTYYKRIVDRLLSQARLTGNFRQDEAGKVFYWITSQRQAVRDSK